MKEATKIQTNKELSLKIGSSQQAISNWVATNKIPFKECLEITTKHPEISLEYLLTGKDNGEQVIYNITELLHQELINDDYESLSPKQLAKVMRDLYRTQRYKAKVDKTFIRDYLDLFKR